MSFKSTKQFVSFLFESAGPTLKSYSEKPDPIPDNHVFVYLKNEGSAAGHFDFDAQLGVNTLSGFGIVRDGENLKSAIEDQVRKESDNELGFSPSREDLIIYVYDDSEGGDYNKVDPEYVYNYPESDDSRMYESKKSNKFKSVEPLQEGFLFKRNRRHREFWFINQKPYQHQKKLWFLEFLDD